MTKNSLLGNDDLHLFNEGNHLRLYEKLGAHPVVKGDIHGTCFAVWAPDAVEVSVIGDFNRWNPRANPLSPRDSSGIWEGFIPKIGRGALYKYHITSRHGGRIGEKADPFAFYAEPPPKSASVVWDLDYQWGDADWMKERHKRNSLASPFSIYEVHLGSWRRDPWASWRALNYREVAAPLADYLNETGFTHVEFLPIMEHPFYASWGYQVIGYFAPTSRYGTPQDFMYLIDYLHQKGIGVILDWVPSHFATDGHGLSLFDGTHLYEHAHPYKGFHPDWASYIFNYGRNEVRSFLLSNALFWLDKYHADGLRIDAVASMLYLNYSRKEGEWIPNQYGGNENLEASHLLRRLNEEAYRYYPDIQMIAEESTAWPMVSRPTSYGGLGFGFKWDMGWMNDTLTYFSKEPVHRKYHHNELTFRQLYAYTENFILPLSHDEVVHGKGSLLGMMPGDDWQKFANLRLLFGYQFGQTGKKLIFMGGEFGQWSEWNHNEGLEWHLLDHDRHRGIWKLVRDLNRLVREEPALHELDCRGDGFEWIDCQDHAASVISFLRKGSSSTLPVLVVCNFTPVPRTDYRVGVPLGGTWKELLNSDAVDYGGSGMGNSGQVDAQDISKDGKPYSLSLTLPPLSVLFFKKKVAAVTERHLCIHGHFYQPPREDPHSGKVLREKSAFPSHDWNERITQECYLPNSNAPILDGEGQVAKRLNNYSRISFDFGPTLLSWMEKNAPAVYRTIIESDRESMARFSGHGSAMASAYNHIILPLADSRDKETEIRWGISDFEYRFGRFPEGIWLPECAVDLESLEIAARLGLSFTILAPYQARRVRPMAGGQGLAGSPWQDVTGGKIDSSRPYTIRLASGRFFTLFFYNGPISQAVAFERLSNDGEAFLQRMMGAYSEDRGGVQLAHVATDGETFGHHHKFGEMALAYILNRVEERSDVRLTNYGEFLEQHPATDEVEIYPNTSWSCAHGIERWRSDCGCRVGCGPEDQAWRAPLREGVDWLREQIDPLYEEVLSRFLKDPWEARNRSIQLYLDRSKATGAALAAERRFFEEQAIRPLKPAEIKRVLALLKMQRHLLFMFTSCGWFFDTPNGPETRIVIRNALRAIELAKEWLGHDFEKQFLRRVKP